LGGFLNATSLEVEEDALAFLEFHGGGGVVVVSGRFELLSI
jgi:hypothetical protein